MAETSKAVGYAVESAILKVTKIRQRNLLPAARQAAAEPDTGVKILKKSAYYVIRDCASLAAKYVALLAYAYLKDPLKQLKGKFTKEGIIDFVARSRDELHTKQLLTLIFADINKTAPPRDPRVTVKLDEGPQWEFDNSDGPYGDYNYDGYLTEEDYKLKDPEVNIEQTATIEMSNESAVVNKMVEIFM